MALDLGRLTSKARAGNPDFTYGDPQSIGYGGFTHTPVTRAKGTPEGLLPLYNAPYEYIGRGAAQTQQHLEQGALEAYRARSGGYISGRAEEDRRLGADAASSGYSQDLLRRQSFARGAEDQSVLGAIRGESRANLEQEAAQLAHSTGVSLAAMTTADRAEYMNAYIQWKARAAARDAGKRKRRGAILGAAGSAIGSIFGPAGAKIGGSFGQVLGGGGEDAGSDTAGTSFLGY